MRLVCKDIYLDTLLFNTLFPSRQKFRLISKLWSATAINPY